MDLSEFWRREAAAGSNDIDSVYNIYIRLEDEFYALRQFIDHP